MKAKVMQMTYKSFGRVWGLFLYDAVFCLERDKEAVKTAIKAAYQELGISKVAVDFKSWS